MSTMYIIILGILLLLAVYDLVVGVSNDAANFLNSAMGCRVAKRSVIIAVAAVGVVLGASLSGGMMEVARSGIFVPGQYGFRDIMILFLAVMLTDVILLDLFNTFGLPTSTTVSLVFELLGAAVAVALFTMARGGEGVSMNLADYINSAGVVKTVSGIFCSVGVAFTCGCIVMWFSRLLFSFRYQRAYKYIGAAWCALAFTAISYFAVFKGLKHSVLISKEDYAWLETNIENIGILSLGGWYIVCFLLQHACKVNTLKLTVLAGTGALALAFAGNDLVNFIGVFMAAQTSCEIAASAAAAGVDISALKMEALAQPVQANSLYLLAAGLIMVGALIFSRKARTVTETEVKLARGNVGKERFGSCLPARAAVRYTMKMAKFVTSVTPAPIARFVGGRFTPLTDEEKGNAGAAFDLIRATVNLTLSALLISLATSLKLPLSTTYVTFMVAMGSSLADRAWGRDSAVYRITGVLTVIGGWFLTGLGACTAAFVTACVMMGGGWWGIGIMLILAATVLVKSALLHRNKSAWHEQTQNLADPKVLHGIGITAAERLDNALDIYRNTINALIHEDRRALKEQRRRARLYVRSQADEKEYCVLPTLQTLVPELAEQGQILFRINETGSRVADSLLTIVKASYRHIDNNHLGLSPVQAAELMGMCGKVADFFPGVFRMLRSGDYRDMESVMAQAGDLGRDLAGAISRHLVRSAQDDESGIRNGILYLHLLNETRAMVRQAFSLLREQKELFGESTLRR